MTNGEKLREIFPKTIFVQHKESDKLTALVCSDEWLSAEYQEPIPKNDLGVDVVSRKAINGYIDYILNHGMGKKKSFDFIKKFVANLSSVTPLSEHEKFVLSQMVNSDAKTIEEISLMHQKQLAEIYQQQNR